MSDEDNVESPAQPDGEKTPDTADKESAEAEKAAE